MLFSVTCFIGNFSNHAGQAEKDYWNAIRGGQEKYKDNRNNKGRYDLFSMFTCLVLFSVSSSFELYCCILIMYHKVIHQTTCILYAYRLMPSLALLNL